MMVETCAPYIDLLHLFAPSSKVIHVVRYKCKTEGKIRESYTHSTGKVEKTGNPSSSHPS